MFRKTNKKVGTLADPIPLRMADWLQLNSIVFMDVEITGAANNHADFNARF